MTDVKCLKKDLPSNGTGIVDIKPTSMGNRFASPMINANFLCKINGHNDTISSGIQKRPKRSEEVFDSETSSDYIMGAKE